MLRGSRGDAAGTELDSSFIERITVNAGTARSCLTAVSPAWPAGLGSSSADRIGAGRSRRSTPSRGKPGAWGRTAAVTRRDGCCHAERSAGECQRHAGVAGRAASAGIGDAGQTSPLGGGRPRPQVRRSVQLRARPGHAVGGVRTGRGQPRGEHPRRGWPDGRLGRGVRRGARVPGRSSVHGEGRDVSAPAGAGAEDPQARWVGKAAQARHSRHRRPGGPGGAEAGAGTDLRGRLRTGLLRVPAQAAGPGRDRRDPPLRHPGLSVGAGRGHRGVLGCIVTLLLR